LAGITVFANEGQDENLLRYGDLYQDRKYELIVKELAPAVAAREQGKESPVIFDTGADIVYARNLVADSYRMLEKYTQAAVWYDGTDTGYFDGYARYCFGIMQNISYITGIETGIENLGYLKILDNLPLSEKQKYFKAIIEINKHNKSLNLTLYRYLAGEISLEDLLENVSGKNFIEYATFAGINLEISGDLHKARELYTQVLEQKTDEIEALLAANRMGLLALRMTYTTFRERGNLTKLTSIYAVKVSSAKLEENRLYSAYNLIDEDPKTAWVPVGKDGGIGEWVEISFDDPVSINAITLINGYAKSDIAFSNNNRVKKATLEFSDGSRKEIFLQDTAKPQTFRIGKKTITIRLYIDEIYKGAKYDDTCLSGIEIDFAN
jgi:hypothetical protein